MSKDKLVIFDTTLRDGEQSPGASMTKDEKIRIAKMLEKMRVDVIEAGFAIASPGDFEAVKAVAETVQDSTVCSLARAVGPDIIRAGEALKNANSGRIHTFIATSPIHMKYKLQMEPEQVLEQAVNAVRHARNFTDDVEFSLEDGSRSEPEFMYRIIEAVINAGAGTINIPDTVGYGEPDEYGSMFRRVIENVRQFRQGDLFHPLPQRPGAGGRQFPVGGDERCAPGGVHHQWPWRARRQRLPGGNRHGRSYAP